MHYEKLLFAVKYRVHPDDIKFLVDEKPVIDTINDADKNTLMIADIVIDDKSNIEVAALKNAMRVIYWKMMEVSQNKIIGLAWMNYETIHLFEGHVLSPE